MHSYVPQVRMMQRCDVRYLWEPLKLLDFHRRSCDKLTLIFLQLLICAKITPTCCRNDLYLSYSKASLYNISNVLAQVVQEQKLKKDVRVYRSFCDGSLRIPLAVPTNAAHHILEKYADLTPRNVINSPDL